MSLLHPHRHSDEHPAHDEIDLALRLLRDGNDLTREQAAGAMRIVMDGHASDVQIAGLLMGLAVKGETVDELVGCAEVMREHVVQVAAPEGVVDTCGTGGDSFGSFNVSTTAAFVVAAAGGTVAKHGNRAMSSSCGSADVLEELGAAIELPPSAVEAMLEQVGMGFMFAPLYHPAMRHAVHARRGLRVRTLFNLLGPITNPAGARRQVIGVAAPESALVMAEVLAELGAEHVLIVHGDDGMDELTISDSSTVHEVRGGSVRTYSVTPEQVGIERAPASTLAGGDRDLNAAITRAVLSGEHGPRADIVALNAGAALLVAGLAGDLAGGVEQARQTLAGGAALETMELFCEVSLEQLAGSNMGGGR